jgi:hypothetical protein
MTPRVPPRARPAPPHKARKPANTPNRQPGRLQTAQPAPFAFPDTPTARPGGRSPKPVTTGHSPSAQPLPRVPSEEPHPRQRLPLPRRRGRLGGSPRPSKRSSPRPSAPRRQTDSSAPRGGAELPGSAAAAAAVCRRSTRRGFVARRQRVPTHRGSPAFVSVRAPEVDAQLPRWWRRAGTTSTRGSRPLSLSRVYQVHEVVAGRVRSQLRGRLAHPAAGFARSGGVRAVSWVASIRHGCLCGPLSAALLRPESGRVAGMTRRHDPAGL